MSDWKKISADEGYVCEHSDHTVSPAEYEKVGGDSPLAFVCAAHLPNPALDDLTDGPRVRTFDTGATRDTDDGKLDYEGFLSPIALERFARYMHKHRHQADGQLRDSDNWQKGIPRKVYIKSMFRHFMDLWAAWRRYDANPHVERLKVGLLETMAEQLCAIMFNVQGMLHETLKVLANIEEMEHGAVEEGP